MRFLVILFLSLLAASCQEAQFPRPNPVAPTAPKPETPPSAPLYPLDSWTLTDTITSVTPHSCFRDLRGLTSNEKLTVRSAETMLRLFVYWDPTDGIEYIGERSGQEFSLAGVFNSGHEFTLGCAAGGSIPVILSGRVSGRFSDNGRSLSAEEVISYRIATTGEQVDFRSNWIATAPAE